MKKNIYTFLVLLVLTSCNKNNLKNDELIFNKEINIYEEEYYTIHINNNGKYTWDIEDDSIINIDAKNNKIYGKKEGTCKIKLILSTGQFDECIVNVISKNSIKSIDDIYNLDENKNNFITLYVVGNGNGIVKYAYNIYDKSMTNPIPCFAETFLFLKEGVWSGESNQYEIIFFDGFITPYDLEYGDIIICHYDYIGSNIYLSPANRNVYNLYYTGLKAKQHIEIL